MIDKQKIENAIDGQTMLKKTDMPWLGKKLSGKVRDVYVRNDEIVFISSDRQSAFDKDITFVPFKGEVLTKASIFWFDETKHIVKNHFLSSPDPNVMVCEKLEIFPIEFVVRGYLTGVTETSVWTAYNRGERNYCGHVLKEGMKKNQAFEKALVTPTTKAEVDEKISAEEIIEKKIMSAEHFNACHDASLKLFRHGLEVAKKQGLILVDTKYEFGLNAQQEIVLADEVHTPDSSRFWLADSYDEKFERGEDPDNIDKEFLRRWIREHCDPYSEPIPEIPVEKVVELSVRYIQLYEKITGNSFSYDTSNVEKRIEKAMRNSYPLRKD